MSFYICDACHLRYADKGILAPRNNHNYHIVCSACFRKNFGTHTPSPAASPSFFQWMFGMFAPQAGAVSNVAHLLSPGGSNLLSPGGSNIVAQGGLNLLSPNGSNIVAQGGLNNHNNIVAQGGLNLLSPGGSNIVAQGGLNNHNNIVAQGGLNFKRNS